MNRQEHNQPARTVRRGVLTILPNLVSDPQVKKFVINETLNRQGYEMLNINLACI